MVIIGDLLCSKLEGTGREAIVANLKEVSLLSIA